MRHVRKLSTFLSPVASWTRVGRREDVGAALLVAWWYQSISSGPQGVLHSKVGECGTDSGGSLERFALAKMRLVRHWKSQQYPD